MERSAGAGGTVAPGRPVPVHSFEEWRAAARALLARQIAPHAVQWIAHNSDGELFAPARQSAGATLRVSRRLMDLLQTAACCRAPNRWAFLYLVLWRWQHGDKAVVSPFDADGARLHAMARAVRRDARDMHQRIRFRERREDAGPPRFVAWCEPRHDVLAQLARHYAACMARVTWMIATPEASVMWDGARLHNTGAPMGDAPAWRGAWRGIFDPARLVAELVVR
jgi:probable DNA metabolism protein